MDTFDGEPVVQEVYMSEYFARSSYLVVTLCELYRSWDTEHLASMLRVYYEVATSSTLACNRILHYVIAFITFIPINDSQLASQEW